MQKFTALLLGATGLVGGELLQQLLKDDRFDRIRVFTRRPLELSHPKLEQHQINFNAPGEWQALVQGDVLFSTLGTTMKKAGSKKNQFLVDYTYQYQFAKAASTNGVSAYVLVSSAGANPKSQIFYSRMKGELDRDVKALSFNQTIILRPSFLDGNRQEKRPFEQLGLKINRWLTRYVFKKYRPTPAKVVAQAMINVAVNPKKYSDYRIFELNELFKLANDNT
ncbi:oxidoreductase [Sunxiuqinia elliptica]|uniref:NAD(P)H-binding n=1 Tax=Sunxiuqinia elliptica TaxID=655355 RepID=A0A1I2FC18_9BACT|nr:oxidoreductase [Sunxiuqinia elliptica]SFF02298.1 NAD(P)H-binding [Sunxiuqinia elliptica]